ncbi:hypothetical protein ASC89_08105 [Devosia sp. Root413D1]|nr:hypothetical protein ASC89_08105 [Devosia sp. Root413D1]
MATGVVAGVLLPLLGWSVWWAGPAWPLALIVTGWFGLLPLLTAGFALLWLARNGRLHLWRAVFLGAVLFALIALLLRAIAGWQETATHLAVGASLGALGATIGWLLAFGTISANQKR